MCAELHWAVETFGDKFFNELRRRTYTTPKSFLDMVELYIVMLSEKRGALAQQRNRLSVGVTKLVRFHVPLRHYFIEFFFFISQ